MRQLPFTDSPDPFGTVGAGGPHTRSTSRFLLWTARRQWRTLAGGAAFGVVWMLARALLPWALGRAVDDGLAPRDLGGVATWTAVLLALLLTQSGFGAVTHRFEVSCWLQAALGTSQLVGHHVARTGAALPRRLPTGEVVSTVATDAVRLGNTYEFVSFFAGAVASYALVAVLLLAASTPLGLVVLLGVPLTAALLTFVVRPLQRRQAAHRAVSGELTTLGADTVAGLRVLRGVGGEGVFMRRYAERSQQVRRAGNDVAGIQATLDALQVLLPGAFLVLVTWLGARSAVDGQLSAGDLVAFYGYAAFLVVPLRAATKMVQFVVRAQVSAQRVLAVLAIRPAALDPSRPGQEPPPGAVLHDPASGLHLRPGTLTAVVTAEPGAGAALAGRLGRLVDAADDDGPVTLGGVALRDLPVATVRRRVVVAAADAELFTGTLRGELDPYGEHDDAALLQALATACAHDVLDALPRGLDDEVSERGRSFSGGQRQRLALARALLRDPEVLVLVEPTSAVDAHTEAAVAVRLRADRRGRTTVVVAASPLLLDRADEVVLLDGGRVTASGTHHELAHRDDAAGRLYRRTVLRGDLPDEETDEDSGELREEVHR